ncbi:PREDICTED: uncharacterized protein LOC108375719 [Rhagoletis zephyria]|uniref:uncharacterized protein LOC108375719 n=1 Tax=Rhagoletis zephyria TaxID=28612 RepID=UPI0008115999|nr:PREDICTED: uncharacterized protein LOC108375719 [Rhagoletis zephyria]
MAQNFLYMFEFVVDDLLITRPNHCAPEEFPTCCEICFRSSVFVSICDREFGQCVDICAPKCGKCCLFSLESPVTEKDRLIIHIYKKKTDKCKFLVGATDIPIKPLFDKVTESFNIENPNWMEQLAKHTARMPYPKTSSKTTVVDNDCDEDSSGRPEQMCPTSELTKRLLPLFNMQHKQTGNLVLIMRLVCNGPTIVSSFPFSRICSTGCAKKTTPCPSNCAAIESPQSQGVCPMPDPCKKEEKNAPVCRRYFACNADKGCPCEECEDYCDRGKISFKILCKNNLILVVKSIRQTYLLVVTHQQQQVYAPRQLSNGPDQPISPRIVIDFASGAAGPPFVVVNEPLRLI